MTDALRHAVAALPWQQSLRLAPDLVTPGAVPEAQLLAEEAALFDPLNLAGLHVLEIGAANGHFSLAALRRGAADALATDHLAWSLPGMQGQAAAALAARALGLAPRMMVLDPRLLNPEFGRFDLVFGTAFCEQLFNPILALRAMATVTRGLLLLETVQDALEDARPMLSATLMTMPYNAIVAGWAPNPPMLLHLLHQLGFDRILYRNHPVAGTARGIYAALKPEAPAALLDGFGEPWINMTHPR